MNGLMDEWMVRWLDEWWMQEWMMDGWMDV